MLAHERHHAVRKDPLRLFVVRALADALFFLPALRRLAARYAALVEIDADQAAVRACGGDPAPLAAALLSFEQSAGDAIGIDPARVEHLGGRRVRWRLPGALLAWTAVPLTTVIGAALAVSAGPQELSLSLPLLGRHACLVALDVGPVLAGTTGLLRARSLLARRAALSA